MYITITMIAWWFVTVCSIFTTLSGKFTFFNLQAMEEMFLTHNIICISPSSGTNCPGMILILAVLLFPCSFYITKLWLQLADHNNLIWSWSEIGSFVLYETSITASISLTLIIGRSRVTFLDTTVPVELHDFLDIDTGKEHALLAFGPAIAPKQWSVLRAQH